MDTIKFKAFYDPPYFEPGTVLPWPTINDLADRSCFLNGEMTFENMGLFVAALAQYGQSQYGGISGVAKDAMVSLIIRRERPVIGGGIAVVTGEPETDIFPGCCCGLEGWRGWSEFIEKGHSPWMGHDPSPWLERVDQNIIRIWEDGGLVEAGSERGRQYNDYLSIAETDFVANMKQVERDLLGFLDVLTAWAEHEEITEAERLVEVVDAAFEIRPAYMSDDWWKQYFSKEGK